MFMLHCTCMSRAKSKNRRKSGETGFCSVIPSYKICRNLPGREQGGRIPQRHLHGRPKDGAERWCGDLEDHDGFKMVVEQLSNR
ncbi:hypothetical protein ACHMW4_21640 [Mesorhizobium sp. UC22_110]|uniref:hypothetical protein n=1 Tax=unclassified Mesorhizobium TaxID=325217 RepID=UPI00366FBDC5